MSSTTYALPGTQRSLRVSSTSPRKPGSSCSSRPCTLSSDSSVYRNDYYPSQLEDSLDRMEKKLYNKVVKHVELLHAAMWQVDTFTYACQTDSRKMPLSPKLRRLKQNQLRLERADLDRKAKDAEEAQRLKAHASTTTSSAGSVSGANDPSRYQSPDSRSPRREHAV
eukprot:GDKI01004500.1.p1 GENE.GDKI01004500.1~~GDKI01004500.1.p1  ORF type:complete len:167 (-),score=11.37 GDKI01004500.1:213-713(-)